MSVHFETWFQVSEVTEERPLILRVASRMFARVLAGCFGLWCCVSGSAGGLSLVGLGLPGCAAWLLVAGEPGLGVGLGW